MTQGASPEWMNGILNRVQSGQPQAPAPMGSATLPQYTGAANPVPPAEQPRTYAAPSPTIGKAPPPQPVAMAPQQPMQDASMAPPPGGADASVVTPGLRVVGYQAGSAGREGDRRLAGQRALDAERTQGDTETAAEVYANQVDQAQEAQRYAIRQQEITEDERQAAEQRMWARRAEMDDARADIDRTTAELAKGPQLKARDQRDLGQRILDGLAAGLMSFGGNQAGVQALMQRNRQAIDDDLEAQRMQYQAKQLGLKGKETDFERLLTKYGSEDAALGVLKASRLERAAAEAQELAAKADQAEAKNAYLAHAQQYADEANTIKRNALGIVGATQGRVVVQLPNGETAYMSPQQYNAQKLSMYNADVGQQRQTGAALAIEGAKSRTEAAKAGAGEVDKQVLDYGKELAKDAPALSILGDAESAINAANLSFGDRALTATKIQSPLARKMLVGKSAAEREQAMGQVKAQIISDISGSGVSDSERENLTRMIEGAGDTSSLLNTIRLMKNKLNARHDTLRAGYKPEAVAEYERRRGANAPQAANVRVEE